MWVNARAAQLSDAAVVDRILSLAAQSWLRPKDLTICVCATGMEELSRTVRSELGRLATGGLRVALSGISAATALAFMEAAEPGLVCEVRLAPAVLSSGCLPGQTQWSEVNALKCQGLAVTALGLATIEQFTQALDSGVDFLQGEMVGAERPYDELDSLLAEIGPGAPVAG